jgi:nicotinamide-nucleotide amidase
MNKDIFCSIITIGDELLIGQTIDTNSAYIAQQLNSIGVIVKRRVAVGDIKNDIIDALVEEENHSNIIIITGGLGPTADDITKPLLCEFFGGELIENETVLQHVKQIFASRNRPILDVNLKQALVPDVCEVLFNDVGTAPGMLFRKNGKLVFSLPGVPFEMKYLIDTHILYLIKKSFSTPVVIHKTLVTAGEGESFIAERLKDIEAALSSTIKLAYLPKLGIVKLRLSSSEASETEMQLHFDKLKDKLVDIIVADEDVELEQVIATLLISRKQTLSTAESCTGGHIGAKITSIKGCSKFYQGGFIPYQTQIKENILGVDNALLEKYTDISEETAIAMANECRHKMHSDFALSITGHLEKQLDDTFVWIGLSSKEKTLAKKVRMFYDREKNTTVAINAALNLLRQFILSH